MTDAWRHLQSAVTMVCNMLERDNQPARTEAAEELRLAVADAIEADAECERLTFDDWYTSITVEGSMEHNMRRTWEAAMKARMSAAPAENVDIDAAKAADSRYPYTHAADFIREKVGDDYGKGLISRAAASAARTAIAKVLGLSDEAVAAKLADAHLQASPETAGTPQFKDLQQ
jgi:hypothetical protein